MDLQLKARRVLVTGSSRGIGFGIAKAFLLEGAEIAISGRNESSLDAAANELQKITTAPIIKVAGDLTNPTFISNVMARIREQWGYLDILVLNLGSGRSKTVLETDFDEWTRVLQLNLISSVETLRQAVPLLQKGSSSSVIFVTSIAGMESIGAPVAYSAAKAALLLTMKTWSRILGSEGIRVNSIAPGNILFDGSTWDKKLKEDSSSVTRMLQQEVALQRLGTVDEVAAAVLFLASFRASFITGSSLVVDGGQTRSV